MDEQKEYFNTNGLTNDTIKQINKFQEGIEALGKNVSMDIIYAYVERNEKVEGVSEEIYEQLDVLKGYEAKAVLNELPVIRRQAARSGVKLPEIIEKIQETGKLEKVKVLMNISPKALEKIPNLKVFTPFIWLPEREVERFNETVETGNQNTKSNDDDLEI